MQCLSYLQSEVIGVWDEITALQRRVLSTPTPPSLFGSSVPRVSKAVCEEERKGE